MEKPANTFHVVYCANDKYIDYVLVSIKGLLEHNKKHFVNIHVLTDKISHTSKDNLKAIINRYNAQLIIHMVDDTPLQELEQRHFSIYTWYRILIPNTLPNISKVLYLDADTLVNDDLDVLFETDLNEVAIAAVEDDWNDDHDLDLMQEFGIRNQFNCFCAGVMLMNLDYWRKNNLTQKLIDWGLEHNHLLRFPDQNALNAVCQDDHILLPLKYGVTKHMFENPRLIDTQKEELTEALHHPAIIHYCIMPPWFYDCRHPHTFLWHKYNDSLGRHRAKVKHKYPQALIQEIKSKIWYTLHPHFYEDIYREYVKALDKGLIPPYA